MNTPHGSPASLVIPSLILVAAAMAMPVESAPTAGTQADNQVAANARTIDAFFVCDAGKTVKAIFTNGPDNSNVLLMLSDGRELTLPQARSASGARYANADESVVFWNKGDTAFIEESGRTTYSGCAAKS